jgi:hypothetical protein
VRITAVLCWYDEPPTHLGRCVRSLAGICDRLVALDGAWQPYPGAEARSPMSQVVAINMARQDAELLGIPIRPDKVWPSQIAKRDAAMRYAIAEGSDWILVIDADEYIAPVDLTAGERQLKRMQIEQELAATDLLVAEVTLRNVTGDDHRGVDQRWRRLFRAHPTLGVSGSHQGYTIPPHHLHGDTRDGLTLAPALDLTSLLTIEHTPRSRGAERNAAAKAYRHARALLGER